MAGRQVDGLKKINRLCRSPADFARAGWANRSPGTGQNQEQLRGGLPVGTFTRVYQVTNRSSVCRLSRSSIFTSRSPIGREYLVRLTLRTVLSRRPSKARTAPGNAQRLWRIESILDPAVGEQFQAEGFILFAMPSLDVPAVTERVTSDSFPSLRKVGDLYSNRLDSPSGRC